MATKRNVGTGASSLSGSDYSFSNASAVPPSNSSITPVVPAYVIYKLLFFSLAMIVVPIGSYFVLLGPVFKGNSTYAGAFAAVMANVVLIGYVIAAVREDDGDEKPAGRVVVADEKKGQ